MSAKSVLTALVCFVVLAGCADPPPKTNAAPPHATEPAEFIASVNKKFERSDADKVISNSQRLAMAAFPEVAASMSTRKGRHVVPPRMKSMTPPKYPPELQKYPFNSRFDVALVLGADGRVRASKVLGSMLPAFERAVTDSIKTWQFSPGLVDGVPSEWLVVQPYRFQLPERQRRP